MRIRTKTGSYATAKYQLTRSILENALDANYTTEDREAALKFFGGCAFCGANNAPRHDHLIAVFERGDFIRNNVVPACQKCDDSKGRQDYKDWMRNSNSFLSLKGRHFSQQQIEHRISVIEQWQAGYKAKTARELFGALYPNYLAILSKMADLCKEAEELTSAVKKER